MREKEGKREESSRREGEGKTRRKGDKRKREIEESKRRQKVQGKEECDRENIYFEETSRPNT